MEELFLRITNISALRLSLLQYIGSKSAWKISVSREHASKPVQPQHVEDEVEQVGAAQKWVGKQCPWA